MSQGSSRTLKLGLGGGLSVLLGVGAVVRLELALLTLGAAISILLPPDVLLFASIIVFKQFGDAASARLSPFLLTDLFLVAWMVRQFTALPRPMKALTRSERWLLAFLIWAWLTTLVHGVRPYPLLPITIYAAAGLVVSRSRNG